MHILAMLPVRETLPPECADVFISSLTKNGVSLSKTTTITTTTNSHFLSKSLDHDWSHNVDTACIQRHDDDSKLYAR